MKDHITKEQEVINKARDGIEKKTGKTPEELYAEREKRLADTIQLKVPDRVPFLMRLGSFPIKYAGLPESALFYDPPAYKTAVLKTLLDFEADALFSPSVSNSGLAMEVLDTKQILWPGGTLPPDQHLQYSDDSEIMKADEYDLFLTDPTDYMIRYYLPRRFGTLRPFSQLPPLGEYLGGGSIPRFLGMSSIFTSPDFQKVFKAIYKAGQEQDKFCQQGAVTGSDSKRSALIQIATRIGVPSIPNPGGVGRQGCQTGDGALCTW